MNWRGRKLCVCEEPGYFCSGFSGIVAHVENGEYTSKVERCDSCKLYASDNDALLALLKFLNEREHVALPKV